MAVAGSANGVAAGSANGVAAGSANGVAAGSANGVAAGSANGVAAGSANGVAGAVRAVVPTGERCCEAVARRSPGARRPGSADSGPAMAAIRRR